MRVWKVFESDPLFKHSNETLPLDEQRRIALLRMYKIVELKLFPFDEIMSSPKLVNKVKITFYILFQHDVKLTLGCIKNCNIVPILSISCNKSRVDI